MLVHLENYTDNLCVETTTTPTQSSHAYSVQLYNTQLVVHPNLISLSTIPP